MTQHPAPRQPEFLDRVQYRQRRFRDAARVLPVLAAMMMALPLLWPRGGDGQSLTSSGIVYLFGLWVVLIGLSLGLSRVLKTDPRTADTTGKPER